MTADVAPLAAQAAEAVRALNHATIGNAGALDPADLSAAVAELADLGRRLPQALAQIGRHLRALDTAGALRLDADGVERYGRPSSAVAEAVAMLSEASAGADAVSRALDDALQATSTMARALSAD